MTKGDFSNIVPRLYLASQSPRRAELLDQVGIPFIRIQGEVDESVLPGEVAQHYVRRLAEAKASAGWQQMLREGLPPLPVLGSDTSVVRDDVILGKPHDREDALSMLANLSGRSHQVMTAVALCWQQKCWSAVNITEVSFREISAGEREAYWSTGEPKGKAGAYAIQGRGAVFVKNIHGSYSSVVGLPLLETTDLLAKVEAAMAAESKG